jgi:uroporphyrinogen-III decarboxylase
VCSSDLPSDWQERKLEWQNRDYALGISAGSLFGWLRNWMGLETISVMIYDDRQLIEDMMDHLVYLITTTIEPALQQVKFDFASMWEDMAFKAGPMISPKLFKEMMVPRYKQITGLLRKHGIDIVYLDCDGNINQLVPHWLEGGVNCMFPLEIRGGSEPYPIRERYGHDVLLLGGVDKTQLIAGKDAIRAEVRRLEKLVADGGYVPLVDHRVPPDVTLENYHYYLRTKREAFGIPDPGVGELDERLAKRRAV